MRKPDPKGGQLPSLVGPDDFADAFGVSRETVERLKVYADLLFKWQKTINLVAPSTLGSIWHRHFADSAQLLRSSGPNGHVWLDFGSGAGFPGLVLAILRAESGSGRVVLVESDSRKCAFLAEVVRKTGLGGCFTVEIRNTRIENPATQSNLETVDVITARALAPLDQLLELCQPYFSSTTHGLFLKGRDSAREIEVAQQKWAFEIAVSPSLTDPGGQILEIWGLRPN